MKFKQNQWVVRRGGAFMDAVPGARYRVEQARKLGLVLCTLTGKVLRGTYDEQFFELDESVPQPTNTYPEPVTPVVTKATNPKEAIGDTKLNLSVVPDTMLLYAATAFTEGALKYGSYNWRAAGVRASTYIAAHRRHVAKWWNGERCDPKTKVHHLANAMACLAIVLDAELVGKLTDDRPPKADMAGLIESLEGTVKHLKEMSAGLTPHHYTEAEDSNADKG